MVDRRQPTSLEEEVARFWAWTRATRQRPSEWGACYPHWEQVYAAVKRTLGAGSLTPAAGDLLLELLVVDQNRERVLELLCGRPMCGFQVAVRGATHPEAAARRQVAALLGRLATLGAVELLRDLTADRDPGVRVRALSCLRELDPAFAARLADGSPPGGDGHSG